MRILFDWRKRNRKSKSARRRRVRSLERTRFAQRRKIRSASVWDWLSGFGAQDIAVDLGTANTVVYIRGEGIVLREPTVLAVDRISREVRAVGSAAAAMAGRVPEGLELVYPVNGGAVTDYEAASHLVNLLVAKKTTGSWSRPRIIVTTGTGLNPVENRAALETAVQLGARKTVRLEGPLAAAYGADLEKAEIAGLLVVDIGAGKTDLAILNENGIVHATMRRLGGRDWDSAIRKVVAKEHGLVIGPLTAEELKVRLGNLGASAMEPWEVGGRSLENGLPARDAIPAETVRQAILPFIEQLADDIANLLAAARPELSEWVYRHGILVVGGCAMLRGLGAYLTNRLGIPVYVGDDPLYAVAMGAGKALAEMDLFRDSLGDPG